MKPLPTAAELLPLLCITKLRYLDRLLSLTATMGTGTSGNFVLVLGTWYQSMLGQHLYTLIPYKKSLSLSTSMSTAPSPSGIGRHGNSLILPVDDWIFISSTQDSKPTDSLSSSLLFSYELRHETNCLPELRLILLARQGYHGFLQTDGHFGSE